MSKRSRECEAREQPAGREQDQERDYLHGADRQKILVAVLHDRRRVYSLQLANRVNNELREG